MAKMSDYIKNLFFILLLVQFAPLFLRNIKEQYTKMLEPRTQVAYLPLRGSIGSSSYYTHYLKKYFEDESIKAILLMIDSPGGAAGGSEAIAREIVALKKENPKPIITLSENVCASGAYYIAATTDYILCQPSTIVGSIGSQFPHQFKVNDVLKNYNVGYNEIAAGEYKTSTDPFVESTPEQLKMLTSVVESSYENFVSHVAESRAQLSISTAAQWANGKLFSGSQALGLGLVDEIGSISQAVKKIKSMAIIDGEIEWIKPTRPSSWMTMLMNPDYNAEVTDEPISNKLVNGVCEALEQRYCAHGMK